MLLKYLSGAAIGPPFVAVCPKACQPLDQTTVECEGVPLFKLANQ